MAGLGSFLNGYVGGVETRHKWDDRKHDRALADEDRTWARQDHAYTAEERARKRARDDLTFKDEDQARADRAAERKAAADAFAAASGTGAVDPAAPDQRSLDIRPANAPALGFGAGVPAMPNAMLPQLGQAPAPTAPGVPPPMSGMTPQGRTATMGTPPLTVDGYNAATPAQRSAMTGSQVGGAIAASADPNAPDAFKIHTAPPPPPIDYSQPPGPGASDAEKMAWASNAPSREAAASTGRALPPSAANTPAQAAAASNPAAAVTDPSQAPAVQIAAATAPAPQSRVAFGINTPIKVSPAKAKEASASFLSNYLKVGVPKMVNYYLSTGQMDKAQAFDKWAKDAKNQNAMSLWAAGVHAAAIGDENGMMDNLGQYYNSFDDGLSLVRDESHIVRDDKGNMVGAEITFVDKDGAKHTQTFHGAEDLMQQGVYALAPEKMFEVMYEQGKAADAAKLAMAKTGSFKPTPQRVSTVMADLSKNVIGFADRPQDEQIKMVMQRIATEDAAAAAVSGGGAAQGPAPGGPDDIWRRAPQP